VPDLHGHTPLDLALSEQHHASAGPLLIPTELPLHLQHRQLPQQKNEDGQEHRSPLTPFPLFLWFCLCPYESMGGHLCLFESRILFSSLFFFRVFRLFLLLSFSCLPPSPSAQIKAKLDALTQEVPLIHVLLGGMISKTATISVRPSSRDGHGGGDREEEIINVDDLPLLQKLRYLIKVENADPNACVPVSSQSAPSPLPRPDSIFLILSHSLSFSLFFSS